MITETTSIQQLNPGDKIYLPWPEGHEKPHWYKTPDILTIRKCIGSDIYFREVGGMCLTAKEVEKIKGTAEPVPGNLITFFISIKNDLIINSEKEFSAVVKEIIYDPNKENEPECLVYVEENFYQIPFSKIRNIEKISSNPQLEMF